MFARQNYTTLTGWISGHLKVKGAFCVLSPHYKIHLTIKQGLSTEITWLTIYRQDFQSFELLGRIFCFSACCKLSSLGINPTFSTLNNMNTTFKHCIMYFIEFKRLRILCQTYDWSFFFVLLFLFSKEAMKMEAGILSKAAGLCT